MQFGGERRGRCVAQGRVWILLVVILDRGGNLDPRVAKAHERV